MRRKFNQRERRMLGILAVFLLAVPVGVIILHSDPLGVRNFVTGVAALAASFAAATALFGDSVRNLAQPIRLSIRAPDIVDNFQNLKKRNGKVEVIQCYHLCVENDSTGRPIKTCRVWLVEILQKDIDGRFKSQFRFAVPRLMPWAPAEFSPDERSFADRQVFDFGSLYLNLGIFEIAKYKDQGGMFEYEIQCPGIRWFVFQIEAEGFTFDEKYYIELRIEKCSKSLSWDFEYHAVAEPVEKERLKLAVG